MKLSERLMACASFVSPGARVVDVGTDHGYLPIYLLRNQIASRCIAADLREKPLRTAVENSRKYQFGDKLSFVLSDGLDAIPLNQVDTVICAGMGGELIRTIISRNKQVWDRGYRLILQPQSAVPELREFLWCNGFSILEEKLARDGRFIYSIMQVRFGGGEARTVGEYFLPACLKNDPLYDEYALRVREGLLLTLENLSRASTPQDEKIAYFSRVLEEIH